MPSENSDPSEVASPDRRTRKREARRDHLLDLAADLVASDGVDGLTMAALAEAADYAPASLYTYFASRSALLAALQERALDTLRCVAEIQVRSWKERLDADDVSAETAALACLWAFSDLFLAAPEHHPREFRLQQQLLVTAGAEDLDDAASVVPAAMAVLSVPTALLHDAAAAGALTPAEPLSDPIGEPLDGDVARTLAWIVALNGALLVDGLATGLPVTGSVLGNQITGSLLAGWGADPETLRRARELSHRWPQPDAPSLTPSPSPSPAPEPEPEPSPGHTAERTAP